MYQRAAAALVLATSSVAIAQVTFTVNTTGPTHAISPLIYGINHGQTGAWTDVPITRMGGNRWTAYNWETNASNAGSDWYHQNDNLMGATNTPGEAVRPTVVANGNAGRATIVTVPMAGYVAADKNGGGDVNQTPNYLDVRFHESYAAKGSALSLSPNAADGSVYQDEFVNWVENSARVNAGQQIMYSLDNEPDLWASTHARIRPTGKVTYEEMRTRTIEYATAIKNVAPNAKILGPVNYGWHGYRTLQDAPDAAGRDFHRYYLQQIRNAETAAGKKLVDYMDVHYYSEARDANDVRVTDNATTSAATATRVQSARSLYDPTYVETSWITQWSTGMTAIRLLPRMKADIDAYNPGTGLAMTEYNFGGGNHISGGIAQAEALGAFGKEGVDIGTWWTLGQSTYVVGAFKMFLDFDGAGSQFGDTSITANSSDMSQSAIFAATDSEDLTRITLVAINRTAGELAANFDLTLIGDITGGSVYHLTAAGATPVFGGTINPLTADSFALSLPAYSVNTIELTVAVPEPALLALAAPLGLLLRRRPR